MSTLSGIVSKGEKGKPKFQSLDINSLYRGESLEPHQAKSTLPRKHGMQSLGKVPSARRPPANLPSLKSEHSGNDPAISLVPTGGSGWGSKPGETGPPPPHLAAAAAQQQAEQNQAAAAAAPAPQPPPAAAAVAPSAAPPQVVAPPAPTQGPTHQLPIQVQQPPHQQHASASDKSWSSVMSGPGEGGGGVRPPSFLAHQSPQFQHEFPKLSSGDGLAPPTGQKGGSDTQYGPGPSLRPQTEGSWIQGGGRPGAAGGPLPSSGGGPSPGGAGPAPGHPGADPGGARTSSGQSAALGGPMGPAGHPGGMQQQGPMPHQFRGVLPQFMYTQRGNFPGGGGFPPNFPPGGGGGPIVHGLPRQRFPYPPDGRFMRPGGGGHHEDDAATAPRPIIKEEELSKMDDIARDPGWATHDDIDYNQKLAFSDDEDTHKDETVRGGGKDSSRSLSHSSSKEDKRSMEREGDSMERDSDRKQQHLSMRGERERSGPPADHRGPPPPASQDQRQQQGWQGRGPMPPADFRGGPQGPQHGGPPPAAAMRPPQQGPPPRQVEDEEIWRERRRHQSEEVAIAVERAKQRKEEEEKRYEESRAAALQKLQQLEQKMGERARTSESKDEPAAPAPPSPALAPPAPVSASVIPLPDWERDRESRERSRTSSSEGKEDKAARDARDAAEFRQLTQVGGDRGPFMRPSEAPSRPSEAPLPPRGSAPAPTERDRDLRPHEQPVFSRQFQSNLPPRFQKQQAERTERHQFVRPSAAAPSTAAPATPAAAQGFDPRWAGSGPTQHFQGPQAGGGGSKSAPARRSSESERDSDRPPSRDRQPQQHDRDGYRQDQQRPRGNYSDSQRKGNYYEGQDYQRSYSREHDRSGPREEPERQHWERDGRQYDERREADNKEGYDRHMEDHEPRRELHRQESGGEWRGEGGGGGEWKGEREPPKRERDDRPQRPDSRDSRASKESRTSREDKPLQHGPDSDHKYQQAKGESWADAPLDPHYDGKEDKRKQAEYYRGGDDRGRHHAPGPITREKLEAAELRGGEMKRNLTQLRRGNAAAGGPATSQDAKQSDSQVDKKDRKPNEPSHAWHQSGQQKNTDRPSQSHLDSVNSSRYNAEMNKSWADALPDPEPPLLPPQSSDQGDQHDNKEDIDGDKPLQEGGKKPSEGMEGKHYDDDKSRSRTGGSRQNYGGSGGGGSYAVHRSWGAAPPSSRGRTPRGGGAVAPGGRRPQEWGHSESEYSGDEVSASTESGKEDASAVRSAAQRPDKGKGEKDDRNRDARREGDKGGDLRRYEKRGTAGYESVRGGRDGFAPRGEPSRGGRGGFRTRGSVARRMDGYGPPSSKSPFGGTHDEKLGNKDNRKTDGSSKEDLDGEIMNAEDKMKLKQQALSAGIIGSGARQAGKGPAAQVPPRMQRKSESERRDSSRSKTRSGRGRDGARLPPRSAPRQNSSDHGEENWETTSENSDLDDPRGRQDRGGKKPYPLPAREPQPGRPRAVGSGGGGRQPTNPSRAPGAEKAPRSSNNGYGAAPGRAPMMGGSANGGGRGPSSRGPVSGGGTKLPMKDGGGVVVAIQRLDEVKIHDPALVAQAIADLNAQKKAAIRPEKDKANQLEGLDLNNYANNGFQEVRSKKNVKEARQKVEEASAAAANQKTAFASGSPVIGRSAAAAPDKDRKPKPLLQDARSSQDARSQDVRSSQQEARPAPREGVAGGGGMAGGKAAFERPRQSKLPPRLAKQRENNRLQKQQQQQHGGMHSADVNEMNLINQNISLFPIKDHAPPPVNAWDKPLRPNSPSLGPGMQLGGLTNTETCGLDPSEAPHSGGSSQRSTPHDEHAKLTADKAALDGSSPPVQTIIFENTNYKTASPQDAAMKAKFGGGHAKSQKGHKMDDGGSDTAAAALGYGNKSGSLSDLGGPDMKSDAIQMPLSFGKEDSSDMKLDFFDSELSQLTEDGGGKKGLGLARAMHNMAPGGGGGGQNPTADLNFKIASVKKVWENMPTVQEHTEDGNAVSSSASTFPPSFGNAVDMGLEQSFGKSADCQQDDGSSGHNPGEVVYSHHPHSPGPQQGGGAGAYGGGGVVVMNAKNDPTSSNVCKVKPQQQAVMAGVGGHPGPMSPPPFNAANPASGHINYQATLGGGANQFGGLSAIPSPPTVLYNSSQQMGSQGGLYGAFQIDGGQVLGGQARSQFSQFPPYGLTQGLGQTSAFNQQSMYLTSPHPPPSNAQDMYQTSLSQYRIQPGQGPFGQSQPLSNNQSTVMISSASNSLMSASVKPPAQQIGAIGTKGGVPYQTASMPAAQQPSQMYIQYDPSQVMGQSYLSSSQLVQRPGPVQSNVVPSIQPSSSYYSGSAPGQGAFYQAASSSIQTAQQQPTQQLHQSGGSPYGLQGYTAQSANGSMQSFGSQFLSSPLQMAQPYRTAGLPAPPAYMKPPANQHVMSDAAPQQQAYLKMADHSGASNGRSQLKSPSSNEAVMQSVFSGGTYPPQIPSPKSRNNMNKQQQQPVQQQQQSPTQQQQHKYGSYQTVAQSAQMAYQQGVRSQLNLSRGGGGGGVPQGMAQPPPRYPPPIQRPNVAYQQVAQQQQQQQQTGANMMGSRHRPQHNTTSRPPPNVNKIQNYYGGHSNLKIDSNTEGKQEINTPQSVDAKLSEVSSAAGTVNATGIKPAQPVESKMTVDAVKDESSTPATE